MSVKGRSRVEQVPARFNRAEPKDAQSPPPLKGGSPMQWFPSCGGAEHPVPYRCEVTRSSARPTLSLAPSWRIAREIRIFSGARLLDVVECAVIVL